MSDHKFKTRPAFNFCAVFYCLVDCGCLSGGLTDSFSSLQALSAEKSSADVNSSRANTVECVRATVKVSDAFAPNKAKTGVSTGERRAQLHFQAATATSVRMEEFAPPY